MWRARRRKGHGRNGPMINNDGLRELVVTEFRKLDISFNDLRSSLPVEIADLMAIAHKLEGRLFRFNETNQRKNCSS